MGRFFQVDPLAHKDHSVSPFAYAGNNPVMLNDPSGLMVNYSDMMERQRRAMERVEEAEQNRANAHLWSSDASFNNSWMTTGSNPYDDVRAMKAGKMTMETYLAKYGTGVDLSGESSAVNVNYYSVGTAGSDYTGSELHAEVEIDFNKVSVKVTQGGGHFFDDPTLAYNYMYNNSFPKGERIRENAAFIVKGGVIVLPTEGYIYNRKQKTDKYYRSSPNNSNLLMLPWEIRSGSMYVTLDDIEYEVLGTIHTHPNSGRADFGDMYGKNRSGDWQGLVLNAYDVMYVIGKDGVGKGWKDPGRSDYTNGGLHYNYEGSLNSVLNGDLILNP